MIPREQAAFAAGIGTARQMALTTVVTLRSGTMPAVSRTKLPSPPCMP